MADGEQTPTALPLRTAVPAPTTELKPEANAKPEFATELKPEVSATVRQRFRVPFARAARRLPTPRQATVASAHAVRAWSRGPNGRLVLPALLLFVLMAGTGAAGAILVPTADQVPRATDVEASAGPEFTAVAPTWPALPIDATALPATLPTGAPAITPPVLVVTGRPSTVLTDWARQTGARVGVPAAAMQAYGYAELVLAQSMPKCRLTWTTLAAIGKVESNHGQFNGATIGPDGVALPKIIGLPLDGEGGRQRILDTDGGELDGDTVLDRAVGPMQFIPTTWRQYGVDADNDGVKNPHSIDDAALTAGNYLCKGGRDLTVPQDWWNAILSYNDVRIYAQAVFDAANQYGASSRT